MDQLKPGSDLLEGVTLTELRQIGDERGTVLHLARMGSPGVTGIGECYFSEILPGAIKAWRRHRLQTQNFAVPVGQVRLVIHDDRPGSSTRGATQTVDLGRPHAYHRLKIPPNLWYGFQCLGREPALLANCADLPHDPSESERLEWNDPTIPYRWPPLDGSPR